MKNFAQKFIRRALSFVLTKESGNTINVSLFKFKNKHQSIIKLIYGKATDEDILNTITKKLVGKIDILMIHSSLNDMIPMYTGNPGKLLSLLISYCAQNNITLTMPAFFNGSNHQAKEHYENGKNIFDVRTTVSEMGLISEMFRRNKNVKRSIHPTHSICALGPLAERLTKNHHLADSTFGEGSPFGEMNKYRTMILGIGTTCEVLTQIHSAEDIMKDKYPIILYSDILPVICRDDSGNMLIYNLRIRKVKYKYDHKSFSRIMKGTNIIEWTYKGIPFFQTQANLVTETFIKFAKQGQTIYKEI
ncbi:MAG: AAC(3) family N-acetyltransferase [Ignavibacteriaceae bacterium]